MTNEQIAEIKARCARAKHHQESDPAAPQSDQDWNWAHGYGESNFRTDIPALLAEREELVKRVKEEQKIAMNLEWSVRALRRKLVEAVDLIREASGLNNWNHIDDTAHAADELCVKAEKYLHSEVANESISWGDSGQYEKDLKASEARVRELEAQRPPEGYAEHVNALNRVRREFASLSGSWSFLFNSEIIRKEISTLRLGKLLNQMIDDRLAVTPVKIYQMAGFVPDEPGVDEQGAIKMIGIEDYEDQVKRLEAELASARAECMRLRGERP